MKVYYSVGIMSGTSLDGVDIVYVKIESGDGYTYTILNAKTYAYSDEWIASLKNAFTQSASEIEKLDKAYGKYLGKLVLQFQSEFQIEKLDFIASHGHTIFHKPESQFTLQIGDGKQIAKLTNTKVVYDFRTQDVALGGQGAPLVPIGDQLLFSEYDFCLNLGGFANISYENNEIRKAFDICPVNIVLNHYMNTIGKTYDDKGQLAASGKVHNKLLEQLNSIAFYELPQPKSLGYEFVVTNIFPLIAQFDISIADVLRTFIEHAALKIAEVFSYKKGRKVLVTGGGAYNIFLMERIRFLSSIEVIIPSKELVEYKEALVFSLLGLLRLEAKVNCLKSVTGAREDHSSGCIVVSID